jgi:hypothetical protein
MESTPLTVDERGRPNEAEVEQRHTALPAGENVRLVDVAGKKQRRAVEIHSSFVRERRRLHRAEATQSLFIRRLLYSRSLDWLEAVA